MGLMMPPAISDRGQKSVAALYPTKSMACRCNKRRPVNSMSGDRRRRLRVSRWGVGGPELPVSEMANLFSRPWLLDGDRIPEAYAFWGFGADCAVEGFSDPWELSPIAGRYTILWKEKRTTQVQASEIS